MIDQAEQLRRRLEARAKGEPLPPIPEPDPAFQPPPLKPESAVQPSETPVFTELKVSGPAQVEVVNINISFLRMVELMVKTAFATIPAALIIAFIWWFVIQIIREFLR